MLYVRARVRARTAYTISEQNGFFRAGFHPPVTRLTPYFFYIYIKVAKLRGRICRCGLLPYAAVAEKITASELGAPYRQAASSATPCSTSRLPIFSARSGNPPALVEVEPTARDLQTSSVITAATEQRGPQPQQQLGAPATWKRRRLVSLTGSAGPTDADAP